MLLSPVVSEKAWLDDWDAVVAGGDAAAIEEFWLARLADGLGDGTTHAEALRRLRSLGKRTLAPTLLELAADQAAADGAWPARRLFLAEMIRLGVGDPEKGKSDLDACLRRVWAGRPSLDKLLAHFPLKGARKPLETLEVLENWLEHDVGGVFAMTGRGAGRVVEVNPQLGMLRLDFEREKRVPVPIDAARKHLTPLPPSHVLRRRLEDRDALVRELGADPAGALAAVLESFGVPMTVPEIKAALGGLVAEEQWTSWWNKAKKQPRLVASGSGSRVSYRLAGGGGAEEEIRAEFARAALEQRLDLARRHGGRSRELAAFLAGELLAAADAPGAAPASAWEALALARRFGAAEEETGRRQAALLARVGAAELLASLADPLQREAVLELVGRGAAAETADAYARWLERETHPRVLARLAAALREAGAGDRVDSFLDQVFLNPVRNPAAFVWACELSGPLATLVEERRGGALLVRLVEVAERREMGPHRARLKELLAADGLAGRIVQERLTLDQGRRILQILDRPGDLADERNWLRRAVMARYPELRQVAAPDVVPALAATVTRLQAELKTLLEKEIPETLKAIQVAKEHGDLSENFEYHAARARQEFLSARAANLQADLVRVRVIDPARVDTSRVRVGTRVLLRGKDDQAERSLVVLGPYEAEPEKGVLSFGSEAAQALLERAIGDTVAFDRRSWTVERIEPAT